MSPTSETHTGGPASAGLDELDSLVDLDTRSRLLRAATELFVEKGFFGARVADIARRAGYTPGALYVHFASRADLLNEAVILEGERLIDLIVDQLRDHAGAGSSLPRQFAEQTVADGGALDVLLLESLALCARDETAADRLGACLQRLNTAIADEVDRGVADGAIDIAIDRDALCTFFTSWLLGLVVYRSISNSRPVIDEVAEIVERVDASLAPETTRSS